MKTQMVNAVLFLAPQIKVSENRLTAAGDKGYCMIRATHGTWNYETIFSVRIIHVCTCDHPSRVICTEFYKSGVAFVMYM